MILVSLCRCLCPINWSQVLNRSWRCSWSSADRRCSNYIWVIDNFIAYQGASYIRDLTVHVIICFENLELCHMLIIYIYATKMASIKSPTWVKSFPLHLVACYFLRLCNPFWCRMVLSIREYAFVFIILFHTVMTWDIQNQIKVKKLLRVEPVCNDHLYNKIYYLWSIR